MFRIPFSVTVTLRPWRVTDVQCSGAIENLKVESVSGCYGVNDKCEKRAKVVSLHG